MIYLSRHGLRLNKVLKEYRHDPDPPLHHSGIQPLLDNSQKIPHLDYVFTSPFIRCIQTAQYLNPHNAPIYVEFGLSETLKEKWFEKCGYNPLRELVRPHDLKMQYYSIDDEYDTAINQTFPETRRDSRRRTRLFTDWLQQSQYWGKDILLVGHGFSIKDCLGNFGVKRPYQGWEGGFPPMGHLFSIDETAIKA